MSTKIQHRTSAVVLVVSGASDEVNNTLPGQRLTISVQAALESKVDATSKNRNEKNCSMRPELSVPGQSAVSCVPCLVIVLGDTLAPESVGVEMCVGICWSCG
jgi:hypothetical protein